jgi:hypothetical protein
MGDPPRGEFHSDDPQRVVFDDTYSRWHQRLRLVGAATLILAAFVLPRIEFFARDRQELPVEFSFFACGVLLLLWEAHAVFIRGAATGQRGFIIIDAEGIGGDVLKPKGRRIAWSRLRSVKSDARAVVVAFEPVDLSSSDPLDRVSEVRLAAPHATSAKIIDAIHRFWTPPGDASHSD